MGNLDGFWDLPRILAAWGIRADGIGPADGASDLGVWFVRDGTRELVLRRLRDAAAAARETRLLEVCRETCPVPEVLPTLVGSAWHAASDGTIWQMQARLPGWPLPEGYGGPRAANAYRLLAAVHAALRRVPADIPDPQDLYARYGMTRIRAAVHTCVKAFPELGSAARGALACWDRGEPALRHRPRQWIHGDTHRGNWLVDGDGRVCALVDFAEARIDAVEWDLAGSLASFARPDDHWASDVEDAISGYRDAGGEVDAGAVRTACIGWQLRGLAIWADRRGGAAGRLVPRVLRGLEQALRWQPGA